MIRIGILTHNALHHTQRCLASLQAHTSVPWEALIVDNASTDDTPAWLSAVQDPRIRLELRRDNLGVGGGRNRLFELLLPDMQDQDLLVFLDNDIEVGAGWAEPFVDAFANNERLGVAGRWAFSMCVHETWRDILPEHNANAGPVDTVQGCCFWVRGATARALGGFDESLGRFWHEDDDYCVRALHAGWDVERVRCDAIEHHEHGSGVALRPERIAGSLANQAMLAAKWRAFGGIDEHGIPRRPTPEPMQPTLAALATSLGRRAPLLRTELNNAIEDAATLLKSVTSPDPSPSRATVMATPAVRAMLHATAQQSDPDAGRAARDREAEIFATLAQRRAALSPLAASAVASRGVRQFSAVCNPSAWDDARWWESYLACFRDGTGRDFYCRTETAWRDGQLAHALRTAGMLRTTSRVLVIGHATERLIVAMTHLVGSVTVWDTPVATPEMLASVAGRPLGLATLECAAWPPSSLPQTDGERFDVVLCPNVTRYASPAKAAALLQALGACVRPRGVLAVGGTVQLSGEADDRWMSLETFAHDAWVQQAGLRRVGAFDAGVSDETLLAVIPPDQPQWRPRFAREVDGRVLTMATLVARHEVAS